jgi:hypothetical protein
MKSKHFRNAIRVGQIVMGTTPMESKHYIAYPTTLKMEWDSAFPKKLKTQHLSIVYFILVNDEVYKIGQTSGKSGIYGCMNFYLNAGTDNPGPNRFAINYLMREELAKGNKIEVYMLYQEPIKVSIQSVSGKTHDILAPIDAKKIEETCVSDYIEMHGNHPVWNYQEAHLDIPHHINEAFADYRTKRAKPIKRKSK